VRVEDVIAGRPIRVRVRPSCRTQVVHVSDVADAAVRALRSDYDGPAILADPTPVTVGEMAQFVADLAGGWSVETAPEAMDVPDTSYDTSRAREVLGWQARISLEAGLAEQMAVARARGPVVPIEANGSRRPWVRRMLRRLGLR
jgi:nucleoside-diphosphate-sugar epimerase